MPKVKKEIDSYLKRHYNIKEDSYYYIGSYETDMTAEELAVFKEALRLSKGKTNNNLAAYLAQLGMGAEDIAKIAKNIRLGGESCTSKIICRRNVKLSPSLRVDVQRLKRVPNFFDTVRGKDAMVRKLVLARIKKLYRNNYNDLERDDYLPMSLFDNNLYRDISAEVCWHRCNNDIKGLNLYSFNSSVSNYLDFATNIAKSGFADKFEPELLEKIESNNGKSDWTEDVEYDKYFNQDMEALLHIDNDLNDLYGELAIDTILKATKRDFSPYRSGELEKAKIMTLIDEFYHACSNMGITLVNFKKDEWGVPYSRVKAIMRQAIKANDNYNKLVQKQGFLMSVARQVVTDELNAYINEHQCCSGRSVRYRFVELNNIEDAEPIVKPTKKPAKKKEELAFGSLEAMKEYFDNKKNGKEDK